MSPSGFSSPQLSGHEEQFDIAWNDEKEEETMEGHIASYGGEKK